jgi:hypothetical protein
MANLFGLAGAVAQKATRYAPIYNPRWTSGIWTNRSPLRDATTNRITEKFYGAAGDALIAGTNVEVSNKLTLIRRPGNSTALGGNSYNSVDRFYDFHLFGPTTEQIEVMIDQTDGLYAEYAPQNPAKQLIFTKSAGAGQTYMQSVGNILYFGNGVDNKKYLQTLLKWTPNTPLNTPTTPFLTSFLIDPNGNIQQLTGTVIPVAYIYAQSDTVQVITNINIGNVVAAGDTITFPSGMAASFLDGQTVTVLQAAGNQLTFNFITNDYAQTPETGVYASVEDGDGTPVTGASQPIWSVSVPSSLNYFQGGLTIDGTAVWTNRGNPVENWGLANATNPLTPAVQGGVASWAESTYYSLVSVIIDPNGNLQQVTTAGLSGTNPPNWATTLGGNTYDGAFPTGMPSTGTVWTMVASAAQMVWQANTNYPAGSFLLQQVTGSVTPATFTISAVTTSAGGVATYAITSGGSANAWYGYKFTVAGMTGANNGVYYCTASTSTTLVLNNPYAIAETHAGTAISTNAAPVCLFQAGQPQGPYISGPVSAYIWAAAHNSSGTTGVGTWDGLAPYHTSNPSAAPSGLPYGQTAIGSSLAQASGLTSFDYAISPGGGGAFAWNTVNSSGATTGTTNPFPGQNENLLQIIVGTLEFPAAGDYTFVVTHGDGMVWGMGGTATFVSGTAPANLAVAGTNTSLNGYPIFPAGNNLNVTANSGNRFSDTYVVNVPAPGTYPVEFNIARWDKNNAGMSVTCAGVTLPFGQPMGGGGTSGATPPVWPVFTTADAPLYASVSEGSGRLDWSNIGFSADFVWKPAENFTLPNTSIIDSNSNNEGPFRTGYTTTGSAPSWSTGLDTLTDDNPYLIWINLGPNLNPPKGALSTSNGGWVYAISLVNTLDDTVSNATKISAPTGNHEDFTGVYLSPGEGLPPLTSIDPQADYVAIWRSTDGQVIPFLIPMANSDYAAPITISLHDYLLYGYTDTTPDVDLNNLISAPILGENTPPAAGATNLAFYLNRIFYSVGATVYWTTGPATPAGNGLNGTAPLNFDEQAALVNRIVPTTSGAFIFTVSDINLIQSTNNASSPISGAIPLIANVGLLSYNALDICGAQIGFFSTDHQFLILDPNAGVSSAGYPLGDQFRLNNGLTAQSWNPKNVYVAWHVNGEDQAWYVGDGSQGWFRMMSTPAPETGSYTWSPYAKIVSGVKALQSVEVSPGNHQLLLGPPTTGLILQRDLDTNQDGGTSYPANAVMGSCVLAQPGQIAVVPFITVEQVGIGTPIVIGVLIDEALPYYTGPFNILKKWENDPPNLKPSISLPSQRFYLADDTDYAAAMRHIQIQINWAAENFPSELLTVTIYGGYVQES